MSRFVNVFDPNSAYLNSLLHLPWMSTNIECPVLNVALTGTLRGQRFLWTWTLTEIQVRGYPKWAIRSSSYNGANEARQKLLRAKTTFPQTQKITSEWNRNPYTTIILDFEYNGGFSRSWKRRPYSRWQLQMHLGEGIGCLQFTLSLWIIRIQISLYRLFYNSPNLRYHVLFSCLVLCLWYKTGRMNTFG